MSKFREYLPEVKRRGEVPPDAWLLFKIVRESLGLSQDELADYLGVSKPVLQRWENQRERLPSERLDALMKLSAEFMADTLHKVEQIREVLLDQPEDSPIRIIVYRNEADYAEFVPDGWPTAKMNRIQISRIYQAIGEEFGYHRLRLVPFDRKAYTEWLGGRKNTSSLRAEWSFTVL